MTGGDEQTRSRTLRMLGAAACLAGALYLGGSWNDERRLEDAKAAGRAGAYQEAIDQARRVTRAPSGSRALVVEAHALLALGDAAAAAGAFARAAEAAPNDAEIRRGWGLALLRAGRRVQAQRQFARASALDPGLVLPPGFVR